MAVRVQAGFIWRRLSLALTQYESISSTLHPNFQLRSSIFQSLITAILRSYTTEILPQMSTDLLKIMEQRLSAIEHRTACLQNFLNQPEASPTEYARANKELRKLSGSMALINELRAKQREIDGLKALLAESSEDKEIVKMATEELGLALEEETRLQKLLLQSLLPKDDADERDCILEVRAGKGSLLELNMLY